MSIDPNVGGGGQEMFNAEQPPPGSQTNNPTQAPPSSDGSVDQPQDFGNSVISSIGVAPDRQDGQVGSGGPQEKRDQGDQTTTLANSPVLTQPQTDKVAAFMQALQAGDLTGVEVSGVLAEVMEGLIAGESLESLLGETGATESDIGDALDALLPKTTTDDDGGGSGSGGGQGGDLQEKIGNLIAGMMKSTPSADGSGEVDVTLNIPGVGPINVTQTQATINSGQEAVYNDLVAQVSKELGVDLAAKEKAGTLKPDEAATVDYLKAMAFALTLLSELKAVMLRITGDLNSDLAIAKKEDAEARTEIAKEQLEETLFPPEQDGCAKVMEILMPILIVVIAVLTVISAGAFMAMGPMLIAVVVTTMVMATMSLVDTQTQMFNQMTEAMGIDNPVLKAVVTMAVMAVVAVASMAGSMASIAALSAAAASSAAAGAGAGAASGASAAAASAGSASATQVAAQSGAAAMKEALKNMAGKTFTQNMKTLVDDLGSMMNTKFGVGMTIGLVADVTMGSNFIPSVIAEFCQACGLEEEAAMILQMILMLVLLIALMAAGAGISKGMDDSFVSAALKTGDNAVSGGAAAGAGAAKTAAQTAPQPAAGGWQRAKPTNMAERTTDIQIGTAGSRGKQAWKVGLKTMADNIAQETGDTPANVTKNIEEAAKNVGKSMEEAVALLQRFDDVNDIMESISVTIKKGLKKIPKAMRQEFDSRTGKTLTRPKLTDDQIDDMMESAIKSIKKQNPELPDDVVKAKARQQVDVQIEAHNANVKLERAVNAMMIGTMHVQFGMGIAVGVETYEWKMKEAERFIKLSNWEAALNLLSKSSEALGKATDVVNQIIEEIVEMTNVMSNVFKRALEGVSQQTTNMYQNQ